MQLPMDGCTMSSGELLPHRSCHASLSSCHCILNPLGSSLRPGGGRLSPTCRRFSPACRRLSPACRCTRLLARNHPGIWPCRLFRCTAEVPRRQYCRCCYTNHYSCRRPHGTDSFRPVVASIHDLQQNPYQRIRL
jgi:hypothetical protein